MRGTVKAISRKNGFLAVLPEDGEYSIVELLGGYDIEVGHVLSGALDSIGEAELANATTLEKIDVINQDIHANLERARRLLES